MHIKEDHHVAPKRDCSFEDAIQQTGFGFYNLSIILYCGLGILGVITESTGLSIIIPVAQCDLELNNNMKGILSSMSVLGILISSQVWGYLGDTRGRRMMILPLFLSVLSTFISTFSVNYIMILTMRLLTGILIGSGAGAIYAYISEFHGIKYRSSALIWTSSFVSAASVYVPGLAWIILPQEWSIDITFLGIAYKPWRLMLFVISLPTLISATALLFYPESPKYLLEISENNKALEILKDIYHRNTGKSRDSFPVENLVKPREIEKEKNEKYGLLKTLWKQTIPIFLPPYLSKTLLLCSLQFVAFFSSLGFYNWVPYIMNIIFESSESSMSICEIIESSQNTTNELSSTSSNSSTITPTCHDTVVIETIQSTFGLGVVMFTVYIIAAFSIQFMSNKIILIFLFVISGIGGVIVHVVENQVLLLILMCMFILSGITVGVLNTFTPDMYPTKYRAMAISISFMFGRIGGVAGSIVVSYLLDFSCNVTFYVYGGMLLVGAAIALRLPMSSR